MYRTSIEQSQTMHAGLLRRGKRSREKIILENVVHMGKFMI